MAPPTIPSSMPTVLVAGDSATWDDSGFSHPLYGAFSSADGWSLVYSLVTRSAAIQVTASVNGNGWRTRLTADQTLQLKDSGTGVEPEPLRWIARVSQGSDVFTVASGVATLHPGPAQEGGGYTSHAQEMLVLVRGAIKSLVSGGIKAATIQGRAYTKNDLTELTRLEARYAAQVELERSGGRLGSVEVTFG